MYIEMAPRPKKSHFTVVAGLIFFGGFMVHIFIHCIHGCRINSMHVYICTYMYTSYIMYIACKQCKLLYSNNITPTF